MKKSLLSLAGLLAITYLQAQISFAPPVSYSTSTGSGLQYVNTADFNGDGILDMVAANGTNNNLYVFMGMSSGGFTAPVSYSLGNGAFAISCAKINNDAYMDLAVSNSLDNTVSVLMGSSSGTFAAAVNYTVGAYPFDQCISDFNGDGFVDIATVNNFSDNVSVLLGSSTGTFAVAVNYTVGTAPEGMCTADFNRDGHPDLAVANYGANSLSVLFGSSTGTFATAATYTAIGNPAGLASEDFNGDGYPDLALSCDNGDIDVFFGSASGTLSLAGTYTIGPYPYSIAAGDFNGDGHPDLIVISAYSSFVIFQGTATGVFLPATSIPAAGTLSFVNKADLNNDGKLDLVATDYSSNKVLVLMSQSLFSAPAAALSFDGINDEVAINNSGNFDTGQSFSIEFWLKSNYALDTTLYDRVLSCSNDALEIAIAKNGKLNIKNANGWLMNVTALPLNIWTHLAVVYNAASSALNVYKNGILANSYTVNMSAYTPATIKLGGRVSGSGQNATMVLDELRIWNKPLCANEINNNKSGEISNPLSGLVANYHFNQGINSVPNPTVTSLVNAVASTNTGTLLNMALSGATGNWTLPGTMASGTTVTAFTGPTVVLSGANTSICNGETTTLTAAGANTYYWNTAGTNTAIVISPTITSGYIVTGFDANTCANVAAITVSVDACTGLNALPSVANVLSVYPNPGSGAFNIQSGEPTSIVISNVLGETILKTTIEAGIYSLNLSNYPNGVYYLCTAKMKTIKIIKN